jgi:hypothetical protein
VTKSIWQRLDRWMLILEYEQGDDPETCEVHAWCVARGIALNRFRWHGWPGRPQTGLNCQSMFQANLDADQGMEFKMRWL